MKITLLHYTSPPIVGGVEQVLAHHALLMTNAGHQVTILAGRGETFDKRIPVRLLPLLDSRHKRVLEVKKQLDSGMLTPEFEQLRDEIQNTLQKELNGTDILIVHNAASLNKNLPLTAAIQKAYAVLGFPHLILWHHDLAWTTPRYKHELHAGYPWDLLKTHWNGAVQVVISEERRKELSALFGINPENIHVIPNGVDISSFFKLETLTKQIIRDMNLLSADPLLLLPARLTARKNIEAGLQITAALRGIFPSVKLLVTGPEGPHNPANAAYKTKLLAMRDALDLSKNVIFFAEVIAETLPDAVIADLFQLADGLLFPSREEGFGIPLIEAAFSSIPVFCADIPVLRELGGSDVTYFDLNGDPQKAAQAIATRLQGELTSRWARRAKQHYAWDSIYEKNILPLLEEISR